MGRRQFEEGDSASASGIVLTSCF